MKKEEWVCCFCDHDIHVDLTDPCFLDIRTSRDQNEVQQLVCHATCLNRVLHPDFAILTEV